MKAARTLAIGAIAIVAAAGTSVAGSADIGEMIAPNTPEAAAVLSKLKQARHLDELNAQGYSSIDNSQRQFYYMKASQITELIERLQGGQAVSRDDVNWGLDNRAARIYGPPP
jgi:hypothetical protein